MTWNGDLAEIDEIVRGFFADRDLVREAQEARQAAETAPPPEPCIIPQPEFPRTWPRLVSGLARYPCTEPGGRCTWGYEVDMLTADSEPLTLPASGLLSDLDRHLTERAEQRARELREQIEGAFREHFAREHPGQEPPDQVERAVREEMERRERAAAARL